MTEEQELPMEELAALEHGQWQKWTEWMLDTVEEEYGVRFGVDDVDAFRSLTCVMRWRRQIEQPYAELTEREKESDRKEARLKLPAYRKAISWGD